MTVEIHCLPREVVHEWWPALRPILAPAFTVSEPVTMTVDDVPAELHEGTLSAFLAFDGDVLAGAAVVRVIAPPRMRVLHVLALGGRRFWLWGDEMNEALRAHALAHGCEVMTMVGRTGWRRWLPRLGWRCPPVITMWRPVDG